MHKTLDNFIPTNNSADANQHEIFWRNPDYLSKYLTEDTIPITKLRTLFMGTSDFAKLILECLIASKYNIVGVLTQPDRPAGREFSISESSVKSLCKEKNIAFFQPEKIDKEAMRDIRELKPDLIILADYGKILPKNVLEIPKFKSINIHASFLPEYRGPSPIQNAILDGKNETGVTIMIMNEIVDTGDIIAQQKVAITETEMFDDLKIKLSIAGSKLLIKTIPRWINGEIMPQKQDENKSTMCQLIERTDGKIFWNLPTKKIYDTYRAFTPWPGIYTFWKKEKSTFRIKLLKIRIEKNLDSNSDEKFNKKQLGEVFKLGQQVCVQTSDGIIAIDELQLEGKQPMSVDSFVNGKPDFIGSILK